MVTALGLKNQLVHNTKGQRTPNFNFLRIHYSSLVHYVKSYKLESKKITNKIITMMVIRPLDNPTYLASSVLADLRFGKDVCVHCNIHGQPMRS